MGVTLSAHVGKACLQAECGTQIRDLRRLGLKHVVSALSTKHRPSPLPPSLYPIHRAAPKSAKHHTQISKSQTSYPDFKVHKTPYPIFPVRRTKKPCQPRYHEAMASSSSSSSTASSSSSSSTSTGTSSNSTTSTGEDQHAESKFARHVRKHCLDKPRESTQHPHTKTMSKHTENLV